MNANANWLLVPRGAVRRDDDDPETLRVDAAQVVTLEEALMNWLNGYSEIAGLFGRSDSWAKRTFGPHGPCGDAVLRLGGSPAHPLARPEDLEAALRRAAREGDGQ